MSRFLIFALVITSFSINAFSCELVAPVRHTNPDGSHGGMVSRDAKVAVTAHIGFDAKVCDKAWVDGNAKILDLAEVKEEAWVREFSVIKDRATVAGKAVVWGTKNTPAEVGEDSKIYGEAKVMTGTKVSGTAEVYGTVTLEDSVVSADARVCEGYILKDQFITDSYFCTEEEVESRATVKSKNFDEAKFNIRTNFLELEAGGIEFLNDRNIFEIFINGTQIAPVTIEVNRKRLLINDLTAVKEGENELIISGRDQYGKKISDRVFNFLMGSGEKIISINSSNNSLMKFNVVYSLNDIEYEGYAKLRNGNLVLTGIPLGLSEVKLQITGAGYDGILVEKFENIEQVPASINITPYPTFINNTLDFSEGLTGWETNHPSNITLEEMEGGIKASIFPHETEVVTFTKTVKLSSYDRSFGVTFQIPQNLISKNIFESQVEVIIASKAQGTIEYQSFSPNSFYKSIGENGLLNLQLERKNIKIDDEFSVFFRILPTGGAFLNTPAVNVLGGEISNFFIDFTTINDDIKNLTDIKIKTTGAIDCDNSAYSINNTKVFERTKNPPPSLKFLSAGTTPMIPIFKENRIFASLKIKGIDKNIIDTISLVGEQNGQVVFTAPLSYCAGKQLEEMVNEVNFVKANSLINHLFVISDFQLRDVSTVIGSKISLRVKVDAKDHQGTKISLYSKNEKPLMVLSSPQLSEIFTYGLIDYYDENEENISRAGGDKWILPAYRSILEGILKIFYSPGFAFWKVGDLARGNGGVFLSHKATHNDGLDADLQFSSYMDNGQKIEFNFDELGDNEIKWNGLLFQIENFLNEIKFYYGYIRDIYISRGYKQNPNAKIFLERRFENRCFNGRIIHFDLGRGEGSLMRDVPVDHQHHIHLRFNHPKKDGSAYQENLNASDLETNYDLDKFIFELTDAGNNLKISPKTGVDLGDKKVYWRYQDKEGYSDNSMVVGYNKWPNSNPSMNIMMSTDIRYIYVSVAKKNGACVLRDVAIDIGSKTIKDHRAWTYKKIGSKYIMELL